ncbi:MAG: hypothetical protein QM754_17710 [Tepidisphaeraceae bacterium]
MLPKQFDMRRKATASGAASDRTNENSKLIALALEGKLSRAARHAVQKQKSRGLAITFRRGNQIVRQDSDGKIIVLATIQPVAFSAPKNIAILSK